MPISICDTQDQVFKWARDIVREGKYLVYLTQNGEVIVEPLRSTRPIRYCYFKGTESEAKTVAEKLSQIYKLNIISVASMSWDIEKGPWVKTEQ